MPKVYLGPVFAMHADSTSISKSILYRHTIIRFVQQEVTLSSLSAISQGSELDQAGGSRTNLELGSLDSLKFSNPQLQSALSLEARELIHFVASRDTHRPPWPFAGEGAT